MEEKDLIRNYLILSRALDIAGQYARENLPTELPEDPIYLHIIAGGDNRDLSGREFVKYWYLLAKKELEEEENQ